MEPTDLTKGMVIVVGVPLRGWLSVDPVVWKLAKRMLLIFYVVPIISLTVVWDTPVWSIPMERSRLYLDNQALKNAD